MIHIAIPITYIQRQRARAVHILVSVDSNQGVATLIQRTLQADDNELERVRCLAPDVVGDLGNIGVVQSSIYFVENKKWCRLIAGPP